METSELCSRAGRGLGRREARTVNNGGHQMRRSVWFWAVILLASCSGRASQPPGLPAPRASPVRVGSTILAPQVPTKMIRPALPPEAAARGIAGPVMVEILIAETGDVSVLSVMRGHPLLDELAKSAVRQWQYRPVVVDGRVVPIIQIGAVPFLPAKVTAFLDGRTRGKLRSNTRLHPAAAELTPSGRG